MAKPFRGSVTLDDGTVWEERDYLAVAAGTIEHIGLNFKPFYRYDQRPSAFQVLGIHASPVGFVQELPRIHQSLPMRAGQDLRRPGQPHGGAQRRRAHAAT